MAVETNVILEQVVTVDSQNSALNVNCSAEEHIISTLGWALGSDRRYVIYVTHFCTMTKPKNLCTCGIGVGLQNCAKRATKSSTFGHCLLGTHQSTGSVQQNKWPKTLNDINPLDVDQLLNSESSCTCFLVQEFYTWIA